MLSQKHIFYTHSDGRMFLLKELPESIELLQEKYCYDIEGSIYFFSKKAEEGAIVVNNNELDLIGQQVVTLDNTASFLDYLNANKNLIKTDSFSRVNLPLDKTNIRRIKRPIFLDRLNGDEIIKLPYFDDDDEMILEVKRWLNVKETTVNQIQEYFGKSDGYNLFYGLRNRQSMTLKAFIKWSEFLELDAIVQLKKK